MYAMSLLGQKVEKIPSEFVLIRKVLILFKMGHLGSASVFGTSGTKEHNPPLQVVLPPFCHEQLRGSGSLVQEKVRLVTKTATMTP